MDIILTKDTETRTVKASTAWYVLLMFIPFVGSIALLVMSIVKKQFKGVILNGFLIGLVIFALTMLLTIVGGFISIALGGLLVLICALGSMVFSIYFYVHMIINANKYSLAQYIQEGYEVSNMDQLDEVTKLWIEENKEKQRAKFLFLEF